MKTEWGYVKPLKAAVCFQFMLAKKKKKTKKNTWMEWNEWNDQMNFYRQKTLMGLVAENAVEADTQHYHFLSY